MSEFWQMMLRDSITLTLPEFSPRQKMEYFRAFLQKPNETGPLRLFCVKVSVDSTKPRPIGFEPAIELQPSIIPHGIGKSEIFLEFLELKSERPKAEKAASLKDFTKFKSNERDVHQMIRYVRLTVTYDQSGTVGGAVDALELTKNGIEWFQRKKSYDQN